VRGLLMPALDLASAIDQVCSPVQKVRLWAESILEAIGIISSFLGGGEAVLGGDDVPSLVLVLTCLCESPEFTYHVKLARLFCLDNYGSDGLSYDLTRYDWGKYEDIAEQYAFDAEDRHIDHSHYLLWAEDTLNIIANSGDSAPRNNSNESAEAGVTPPQPGDMAPALVQDLERITEDIGTVSPLKKLQAVAWARVNVVKIVAGAKKQREWKQNQAETRANAELTPYNATEALSHQETLQQRVE